MGRKYKIHFDVSFVQKLREAINKYQNLSIEKKDEYIRKGKPVVYDAWDRICTILDRLEDTIDYLNKLKLGPKEHDNSAYNFYDYLNNIVIVVEGIETMGIIFGINIDILKGIKESKDIFGDIYGIEGDDSHYLAYIRSVCSIHPFETNYNHPYLKGSRMHCCSRVVWNYGLNGIPSKKCDLFAYVYTSNKGDSTRIIELYIDSFNNYVNRWIGIVPEVCKAIEDYDYEVYEKYRKEGIRNQNEDEDYCDYLSYLKGEYEKRFGGEWSYLFDRYKEVFSISLSNKTNEVKLEKYRNAIKYSLTFLINSMRSMELDGYENTGIKYTCINYESDLFIELNHSFSWNGAFSGYSYNLEKLHYLRPEYKYSIFDKQYSRHLIDEMLGELNKYIEITNDESDLETLILIDMALFFDSLENYNLLNKNIPNDLKYRNRLLTDEECKKLFVCELTDSNELQNEIKIIDDIPNIGK